MSSERRSLSPEVQGGTINFDKCIATPDMMPLVGRLGKIWAPRYDAESEGGTVRWTSPKAVRGAKGGAVEFRVEKAVFCMQDWQSELHRERARRKRQGFADAVMKGKNPLVQRERSSNA